MKEAMSKSGDVKPVINLVNIETEKIMKCLSLRARAQQVWEGGVMAQKS
jgi:hypothetical protein